MTGGWPLVLAALAGILLGLVLVIVSMGVGSVWARRDAKKELE